MITSRTSNINILNDIAATAIFIFDYSLLFQLYKQLDATVENALLYFYLVARFDNGQYELSSGFRGYKVIFFEVLPRQNFSK